MPLEGRPGSLDEMPDDRLGTVAVSLSAAELHWIPDVAPAVMDRISRDAVAYPEQFDRRPAAPPPAMVPATGRSAKRAVGRLAVIAVMLVVIVALVVFVATASAAEASPAIAAAALAVV